MGGTGGGTASCSAANCAGCCFGNQCQAGTTAAACGRNGVECAACATGLVCLAEQTCGIDPASQWAVLPTSAVVSQYDSNNEGWDAFDGPPDPFAALTCPATELAATGRTATVDDSLAPSWTSLEFGSCVMSAHALMTTGFGLIVYDQDTFADDIIAPLQTVKPTEAQLRSGTLTVSSGATMPSMTVKLTRQ
jgi:hypothetical protein